MHKHIDVLIVGQGIVGSLLALRLMEQGRSVLVVDDGYQSSASKIAAGMMNPVSGLRLSKLWKCELDRLFVLERYRQLEMLLGVSFLQVYSLVRFLSRPLEMGYFKKRVSDLTYSLDMKLDVDVSFFESVCNVGMACFRTPKVYRIDVPCFLEAVWHYLLEQNACVNASFEYSDLLIESESVYWEGHAFQSVIFCEGAHGEKNPFFKDLDWDNSYGDILTVTCLGVPYRTILNHGKWLCPIGNGVFKYGASAYWENSVVSRGESESFLRENLSSFLKVPFDVQSVSCGVRPVMKQRQPVSFFHSEYPCLGIINGFGGTGMSQAPLVIEQFVSTYFCR